MFSPFPCNDTGTIRKDKSSMLILIVNTKYTLVYTLVYDNLIQLCYFLKIYIINETMEESKWNMNQIIFTDRKLTLVRQLPLCVILCSNRIQQTLYRSEGSLSLWRCKAQNLPPIAPGYEERAPIRFKFFNPEVINRIWLKTYTDQ